MITVQLIISCNVCEHDGTVIATNAEQLQKFVNDINDSNTWLHPDCPGVGKVCNLKCSKYSCDKKCARDKGHADYCDCRK